MLCRRTFAALVLAALTLLLRPAGAEPATAPAVTKELSQYGITWTFEKPVAFGRFVTGDYYVIGPVTITAVTPAWDGRISGSVVDPPVSLEQGYVKDMVFGPKFNDDLRSKFPLTLEGTKSLVSTIGLAQQRKGGAYEALDTAAVLTVLKEPPPQGAFRPPYVAGDKTIHTTGQLKWDRLPRLEKPKAALPSFDMMQRPWLDHFAAKGNGNATIHPKSNMPPYPGDSGRQVSTMSMLVMLDIPEREMLVNRLVQLGIDLYPITLKNGDAFRGYGGFGNGRKWPILFAGIMLDEKKMLDLPKMVESSNSRTGKVDKFGEDGHTYYGKPTAEYPRGKPLWGNDAANQEKIFRKLTTEGLNAGGDKDIRDPDGLLDGPDFGYRTICSCTWVGPALAARLMGAQKIWDHPAFFDYVDRWIKEESVKPNVKTHYTYGNDFLMEMWTTYRAKADEIGRQYEAKSGK